MVLLHPTDILPSNKHYVPMSHPLTDTICDSIQDSIHPCDPENMRRAADWQLEEVLTFIGEDPMLGWHVQDYIKKAMRPNQ